MTAGVAVLALLIFLARVVALDSDPPAFLSWSTGIYTDEGYYTLDSRSAVLFRHWAIGDFHSAILSPLLYLVQLAVFHLAGVGLIPARSISVVFGLLAILFFAIAVRRLYGTPTSLAAALFLGLSAPFAFYNRLALMETPAVFCLTLAFFIATYPKQGFWAGIAVGVAAIVKPTALLAAPAFLFAGGRRVLPIAAGLALSIALYAVFWCLPHDADLARMSAFYSERQYLPHSVGGLAHNLWRNLATGAGDGFLPYLIHFAPALSLLALIGLFAIRRQTRPGDLLLAAWFLVPVVVLLFFSYTPSRMYVLFWPALAGLAARGLIILLQNTRFLIAKPAGALLLAGFLVANAWQFGAAWNNRTYTLRDGSRELAALTAKGSVIAGQMAPELCLDNMDQGLIVQPGLANFDHPIERYHAEYILVTRSAYWDMWWKTHYPAIINRNHYMATVRVGRSYQVDIYEIP